MSPILVRPVREQLEHDRVIRLSPFSVRAENARSYRATDTLAGTRLRHVSELAPAA